MVDVDGLERIRECFPALSLEVGGSPAVFFDGPAGSQVPEVVIAAMSSYLRTSNANVDGSFVTSRTSNAMMVEARRAAADLLNAPAQEEILFGASMTALTMELSRQLGKTWATGDEIIVTDLDHDANVMPWVLAAERAGAVVHRIPIHGEDCRLDLTALHRVLCDRSKLLAIGIASNLVGTVTPITDIVHQAHAVGAQVFVDAVHYAPHRCIDVQAWDCDYLACSAYKFFGPHIGMLWGRGELLGSLTTDKLRPVSDRLPTRWQQGTHNHEGIAGVLAAVDYLADLGRRSGGRELTRRDALIAAFASIESYESDLCQRLIDGLGDLPGMRVWGITAAERISERTPTVACTHAILSPQAMAAGLGEQGIFTWDGNNYALALSQALGLEPDGVLRIGILHYNSAAEVDRLLAALGELIAAA